MKRANLKHCSTQSILKCAGRPLRQDCKERKGKCKWLIQEHFEIATEKAMHYPSLDGTFQTDARLTVSYIIKVEKEKGQLPVPESLYCDTGQVNSLLLH